jgi:hypothetical protein
VSDPIDHVAKAEEALKQSESFYWSEEPEQVALYFGKAQAHATLALVEQQRAANLIDLAKLNSSWSLGGFRTELLRLAGRLIGKEFPL